MKKIILLVGFGLMGTFALANEPVEANERTFSNSEKICSCELESNGTCYITVYYSNGSSQTYVWYNVTEAWCEWKYNTMAFGTQ